MERRYVVEYLHSITGRLLNIVKKTMIKWVVLDEDKNEIQWNKSDRSKRNFCMARFGNPPKMSVEENHEICYERGKEKKQETENLIVAA